MEEEQSPLLYISFFSVLTGYLCSAKTASRPFGSLKHHIYKLTRDTQLCAICEKAMQSGELYKLRKKCLITPAFYQIEKWLCFFAEAPDVPCFFSGYLDDKPVVCKKSLGG